MPEKILEINSLTTTFHTEVGIVHAVNGISFDLCEGETVGIVGESGSGKSVSMLSVMRLLPQPPAKISGNVIFRGRNLMNLPHSEMRRIRGSKIAMIFQDPMSSLNPVLTVGFQLMETLRKHLGMSMQEARERASELLRIVGIPDAQTRLRDYPHQFSGGMRQRVMIAMALACQPSLLIADEPTTALDVTVQAQIIDLVKGLRDEFKMSLIWITHDLGIVAGLADRILVMYSGYIVEEANVKDAFANPLHPYTAALLKSIPSLDSRPGERLQALEGLPPDLARLKQGCPFSPRCPHRKNVCLDYLPSLYEIEPDHKAACWVDTKSDRVRENMLLNHNIPMGQA